MNAEQLAAGLPPHITADWLRARCDEEADCWIWRGCYSSNGYPMVCVLRRHVPVRRVAALLSGKTFEARQPIATTCGCRDCVKPAHMRPSTIRTIAAAAAQAGAWGGVARAAKISATRLAGTQISDDAVRAVRLAPRGQLMAVAAAHGVNYHTARAIRTGRIRKDYRSPWAGMGARP